MNNNQTLQQSEIGSTNVPISKETSLNNDSSIVSDDSLNLNSPHMSTQEQQTCNKKSKENTKTQHFQEDSLEDLGYTATDTDRFEEYKCQHEESIEDIIKDVISQNLRPKLVVQIGESRLHCQSLVLHCYTKYFDENFEKKIIDKKMFVELPMDKISVRTFKRIYAWIIGRKEILDMDFMDFYLAVKCMQMTELVEYCWLILNDDRNFYEHKAFVLFLRVHNEPNLLEIKTLMLQRMHKFFLSFVATTYFKNLTAEQVQDLLSSDSIGVNTETEVFYAAVLWLNHKWEERMQYVEQFMKLVRFDVIPIVTLIYFHKVPEHRAIEVKRILDFDEVKDMIAQIVNTTMVITCFGEKEAKQQNPHVFDDEGIGVSNRRLWVSDYKCDYHTKNRWIKNHIEYEDFLIYLENLNCFDNEHWKTLEPRNPPLIENLEDSFELKAPASFFQIKEADLDAPSTSTAAQNEEQNLIEFSTEGSTWKDCEIIFMNTNFK